MEQVTIDRIVKVYDEKIKPLLGQKNIPIQIYEGSIDTPISSKGNIPNIITVFPSGSGSNDGWAAKGGALPATIVWGHVGLRSGLPWGDVGDSRGIRAILQELLTCIFAASAPNNILNKDQSILHDSTSLYTDVSTIDKKAFKILTEPYFKKGENGSNIINY